MHLGASPRALRYLELFGQEKVMAILNFFFCWFLFVSIASGLNIQRNRAPRPPLGCSSWQWAYCGHSCIVFYKAAWFPFSSRTILVLKFGGSSAVQSARVQQLCNITYINWWVLSPLTPWISSVCNIKSYKNKWSTSGTRTQLKVVGITNETFAVYIWGKVLELRDSLGQKALSSH